MSVMGLAKSFIFGLEGRGAMIGSFLRSGETLSSAGKKKLVSVGVDGNDGSGVLGVMVVNFFVKHFYLKEENHAHNQKVVLAVEVLADHLELCYAESTDQRLHPNNRQKMGVGFLAI